MTKKKNFHGTGGKGGLVRQMAFYCKKNPHDVMAQPLSKQKKGLPGATNTEQAKGGNQGLPDTDSASHDTKD